MTETKIKEVYKYTIQSRNKTKKWENIGLEITATSLNDAIKQINNLIKKEYIQNDTYRYKLIK